jgi:hypothetical protein
MKKHEERGDNAYRVSELHIWYEQSGQLHSRTLSAPRKDLPVPTEKDDGWDPQLTP